MVSSKSCSGCGLKPRCYSLPDLESPHLRRRRQCRLLLLADVRSKFAGLNCVEERWHFAVVAADLHFYPPVGKVSDPAGNVEALGNVADRPAKAYALNVTFVENLK